MRFSTQRLITKEAIRYFETENPDNLTIEEIFINLKANYANMTREEKNKAIEVMEQLNQPERT